jgi:hypothetical protein
MNLQSGWLFELKGLAAAYQYREWKTKFKGRMTDPGGRHFSVEAPSSSFIVGCR